MRQVGSKALSFLLISPQQRNCALTLRAQMGQGEVKDIQQWENGHDGHLGQTFPLVYVEIS